MRWLSIRIRIRIGCTTPDPRGGSKFGVGLDEDVRVRCGLMMVQKGETGRREGGVRDSDGLGMKQDQRPESLGTWAVPGGRVVASGCLPGRCCLAVGRFPGTRHIPQPNLDTGKSATLDAAPWIFGLLACNSSGKSLVLRVSWYMQDCRSQRTSAGKKEGREFKRRRGPEEMTAFRDRRPAPAPACAPRDSRIPQFNSLSARLQGMACHCSSVTVTVDPGVGGLSSASLVVRPQLTQHSRSHHSVST